MALRLYKREAPRKLFKKRSVILNFMPGLCPQLWVVGIFAFAQFNDKIAFLLPFFNILWRRN